MKITIEKEVYVGTLLVPDFINISEDGKKISHPFLHDLGIDVNAIEKKILEIVNEYVATHNVTTITYKFKTTTNGNTNIVIIRGIVTEEVETNNINHMINIMNEIDLIKQENKKKA